MAFDFTARTVVVTGAGQGIGYEVARLFHRSGAHVVPVDRDESRLHAVWADDQERVTPVAADVANRDAMSHVVDRSISASGRLDVVVNNAGITRDTVVWKMASDQWNEVLDVHLTGTFNLTQAAIPVMRSAGGGRIVNVTSYTGLHGNTGQSNYAAAKAGIIGFTKAVAKEVARFGITVNAISPNAGTAMVAAIPAGKLADLTAMIPAGRFAEPSEMAAAFAFLASDEAAYITGAVLPVDGGVAM